MATKKEQKEFNDSVAALKRDLSDNSFHGVYLLYGEESYLISRYRRQLTDAIFPDGDSMNINVFKDVFSDDEVAELLGTMPFFSDKRIVVLEDTGVLKSANERLSKAVKDMPETTVFIITERVTFNANGTPKSVMDKRVNIYKAVKDKALIINCITQGRQALEKWVLSMMKSQGKSIDARALSAFLELTGSDMMRIENEVEKLVSYRIDSDTIGEADVNAIVSGVPTDRMFEFTEAVARGRIEEAMRLYGDLAALRTAAGRIDAMLIRHFNLVLRAKDLSEKGEPDKNIAYAIGVSPFFVGQYIQQGRMFERNSLVRALEAIAKSQLSQRSGLMDEDLALEVLITDLCKESAKS